MPPGVAITGLGAITALGGDIAALRTGVVEGRCGIGPLTLFVHAGRSRLAAQVPESPAVTAAAVSAATARRLSRADRFALLAVDQACRSAGLTADVLHGAALFVGATTGGMRQTEEAYRRRREGRDARFRISRMLGTPLCTAATAVSQTFGIFGARATFSTACSSSALAIAAACAAVRQGRTRIALAIGADELCRLTYAGFDALQALDPVPCRPFDRDRHGLTLGEGAGALVLEDTAHARARGARIRALVLGDATTSDAHHVTAPDPQGSGAKRAMHAALGAAGLAPDAVDYVNAHGSGTLQNDAVEIATLRAVFGTRLGRIPISSTKSQIGHCLGAAGALEAVTTVLALDEGFVPPTVNFRQPDPAWGDLDFVALPGRRRPLGVAVTSSYGFGGHNVTLVLARPEGA